MSEGVPDPRVLSAAQVRQFDELGYLFPLEVFEAQEVAALRSHVNAQLAYRHSTEAENNVLTQTTLEAGMSGVSRRLLDTLAWREHIESLAASLFQDYNSERMGGH